MKDSIIVLSGGLDSTTLLYEYRERIALAVSFNYGSNHNQKEIAFARYHCNQLNIEHIEIQLSFIRDWFHSSLLQGDKAVPEGNYNEDNMRSTVVPFRNGIMISAAIGIAEDRGLKYVMLGNHSGDHTIYPDCRPEFINAMDSAANAGTWNGVHLLCPYTNLTKAEIAAHGKTLGIDYSKTWSCYRGGEHHCGKCGTCRERRDALKEAGIEDNTIYDL